MYKITVHFKSNVKGVYTHEVETATDKEQANFKYDRMLNRWFDILCPHINFEVYSQRIGLNKKNSTTEYEKWRNKNNQLKIRLIEQMLDDMDDFDEDIDEIETTSETMRKFEITIEEI